MTGNVDKSREDFAKARLVGQLAHSVVEVVAETPGKVRRAQMDEAVDLVYRASCRPTAVAHADLFSDLKALWVSTPELVEDCIASAARRLGDDWLADERGFSEVALASSRLIDFCRASERAWNNLNPAPDSQSIVLATIEREMHLIGPAILAQRLRRAGHSVSLMCNVGQAELAEKLSSDMFTGVMISCASQSGLDSVSKTIKHMRLNSGYCPPIAVGGAVLEFIEDDDAELIGADLLTNDESKALGLFGAAKRQLQLGAAQ